MRFQEHYSFPFTVFNVIQRREMLLHANLKVKCTNFDSFAADFAMVSPIAVSNVSNRIAKGDHNFAFTPGEKKVRALLKQVNLVMRHAPGLSAPQVIMRNEMRGFMIEQGLPSFYVTVNPADVYNPIVKFLAGSEIDVENLLSTDVPDYWLQSVQIAKNPALGVKFFNIFMEAFIRTLLGSGHKNLKLEGGVLGVVKAHYGCVEAQGHGEGEE
ncbi:hypothetical protein F4604DRAFT_1583006 [Suillus subluteus]|nr:hypothetical protein F4604DRAFT_1583006 [Suillus subluteus]